MAGMLQIQDQGRGCRSGPMPSQRPRPQPVSLGRARATWTDWTQRSWRSAGVTRDTGPNCPGTYGRCCLLTFLTVPPPFPQAPQPLPWGSVCISPPGSTRGQRREGGLWNPGPAGSGSEGYPSLQGDPGEAGLQGPKVGEKPAGEDLEVEAVGWGFPSLLPTRIHPAPTHGLARGRGTSAHAG